ncbi:hybrid sensor histidine kinase/response regulator [Hyalangium versicolor]|uniref:hybrid sensor histidine kinase/response regulator n=1 Tax=Hyalangium versicolor TaxID=2861190 RepID=UPI001CD013E0|nr:ATP-binding protein [Hyalangium versicolor]
MIDALQPWRMSDDLSLGLYLVDVRSGRVLYANRQFFQLWHIEPLELRVRHGEALHLEVIEHCLPAVADRDSFLRLYAPSGKEAPQEPAEDRTLLADGRTLQRFSAPVRDARGERSFWVSVFKDITERKRTEESLRRSEISFRKLIESAPESICVHRDRRLVYVNPAMLSALRYEKLEDLLGRPVLDVVHPDDRPMIIQRMQSIVATGVPAPPQEMRSLRSDGTSQEVETLALAIDFDGAPSVLVMGRDITERKQMQAQLLQNDRMVVMGTLAAGVGHEINNPLTFVLSNLSLAGQEVEQLARECEEGALTPESQRNLGTRLADLQEMLKEAHAGAERVRTIVKDLKIFSRQEEEQRTAVDVREVIELAIKMALPELRSRARLVRHFEAVPPVMADGSRLGQVFLNLLVNAAHAIPEGNALGSEISVRARMDASGRVSVEVSDTGVGIRADLLPRIFEPFFTTKSVGSGTGLGLSICHGIVQSLGGEISVRSEEGRGTTFTVLLPVAPAVAPAAEAVPVPVKDQSSQVLIIDDEPGVGRALARMVGSKHRVTVVDSGQEALEQLLSGIPLDVIFCDLMMSDLTGMDLYERVQALRPELAGRFIFMTGGAFTPRARQFLEKVPNGWLEKPFEVEQIRRLMGQVLREHHG